MSITQSDYDSWVIDALHRMDVSPEHLAAVSRRWRSLAERMASSPVGKRGDVCLAALSMMPRHEADAFEAAMDRNPSNGPPDPLKVAAPSHGDDE